MVKRIQATLLTIIMLLFFSWFILLFLGSALGDRDGTILMKVLFALILAPAVWLAVVALVWISKHFIAWGRKS